MRGLQRRWPRKGLGDPLGARGWSVDDPIHAAAFSGMSVRMAGIRLAKSASISAA